MRKLIGSINILLLIFFAQVAWPYSPGFESSNPDTVMHFITGNSAFVYLSTFFGLGVLLAFTPCVLPMVPILSGIIVGQNSISTGRAFKLSLSYVTGMAVTYAVAGMLAGYMGSTIQTIMQRPIVIALFSIVFVTMALSMFGFFELKLPVNFGNRLNKNNRLGTQRSYFSVGMMGVLSTLIVSPCVTAPLIGVLSYIGQNGQIIMGGLILFVMALGMGVPLLIVGAGYGTLLPKAGSWMLKIKQLFGFIMLGIAIWMLSRILNQTIIHILWAGLLIVASITLGTLKSQNNWRGYLTQGLGFVALISGGIILYNTIIPSIKVKQGFVENNAFIKINTLSDLQHQLEQAKKAKKAVFLDFSADWCSDCQEMDANVFNQPEIQKAMSAWVNIKVDISNKNTEVDAIKKAFGIYGTPTMIFFNTSGKRITQMTSVGLISLSKMLQLLEQAPHLT
ncbi:protein-disulfide reductase DsbD [Legionella pneumophila]|uniref:Thiol:disulfide interchange protein DsbD n=1 Tax=Legionella pneumophila subsp. pascullei TaxID=91890 RepID=A0AAX2IVP7_LEGPN|nr:protein-disulfide reductase DsbD [Legionella pneumophila]AMP92666.1 disulfide bond formation protein DsbD [Legionella pneumophila subsp. pascullei]AMP95631.1 disulfide bond formation protein DsbD [Legionella pneumophila subsp. pascullei]SQG90542.1 thiol:disulfide interchange protein DsbD [Legionella pneumophila subsp. pascullei]VEH07087.1 thiol:disulfide interchange protein DsbD [Legionella pneumophila subsp. pascullei]HDU8259192.1 protein-disulfide reductase DsbD [Legionella pneumophila]